MNVRIEKPSAILMTLTKGFFDEYPGGEERFREIIEAMNGSDVVWHHISKNLPKVDIPYLYFVFNNKVQYRLSIAGYERNVTKEFNDMDIIRKFENRNWILLSAPVVKAPESLARKGFQGFRYSEMLF